MKTLIALITTAAIIIVMALTTPETAEFQPVFEANTPEQPSLFSRLMGSSKHRVQYHVEDYVVIRLGYLVVDGNRKLVAVGYLNKVLELAP